MRRVPRANSDRLCKQAGFAQATPEQLHGRFDIGRRQAGIAQQQAGSGWLLQRLRGDRVEAEATNACVPSETFAIGMVARGEPRSQVHAGVRINHLDPVPGMFTQTGEHCCPARTQTLCRVAQMAFEFATGHEMGQGGLFECVAAAILQPFGGAEG